MFSKVHTDGFQKCDKGTAIHFAGRHREFAVLGLTQTADVPRDGDVVRWVGEDHLSTLSAQELGVDVLGLSVPADQTMATDQPNVARTCDYRPITEFRNDVVRTRCRIITVLRSDFTDQDVYFRQVETCERDVDVQIEFGQ